MKFTYRAEELNNSKTIPNVTRLNGNVPATPLKSRPAAWTKYVWIGLALLAMISGGVWWRTTSTRAKGQSSAEAFIPTDDLHSSRIARKKLGLCVGLNKVDPASYPGCRESPLTGCCNDADRFSALLRGARYSVNVLKDSEATIANVGRLLNEAAEELAAGDVFAMLISGHGNRVQQSDGRKQECWCLYDGCVWDTHIIKAFSRFRKGVRILLVSDQCFSGGMFIEKAMSVEAHRRYWETKSKDASWSAENAVKGPDFPQLIQFASSRAEQTSADLGPGGLWTFALIYAIEENQAATLRTWFNSAFSKVPRGKQEPQWVEFGPVSQSFRDMVLLDD